MVICTFSWFRVLLFSFTSMQKPSMSWFTCILFFFSCISRFAWGSVELDVFVVLVVLVLVSDLLPFSGLGNCSSLSSAGSWSCRPCCGLILHLVEVLPPLPPALPWRRLGSQARGCLAVIFFVCDVVCLISSFFIFSAWLDAGPWPCPSSWSRSVDPELFTWYLFSGCLSLLLCTSSRCWWGSVYPSGSVLTSISIVAGLVVLVLVEHARNIFLRSLISFFSSIGSIFNNSSSSVWMPCSSSGCCFLSEQLWEALGVLPPILLFFTVLALHLGNCRILSSAASPTRRVLQDDVLVVAWSSCSSGLMWICLMSVPWRW